MLFCRKDAKLAIGDLFRAFVLYLDRNLIKLSFINFDCYFFGELTVLCCGELKASLPFLLHVVKTINLFSNVLRSIVRDTVIYKGIHV